MPNFEKGTFVIRNFNRCTASRPDRLPTGNESLCVLLEDVHSVGNDFPFSQAKMQTVARPSGWVCEPKDFKACHDDFLEAFGLESVGVPIADPPDKGARLADVKTEIATLQAEESELTEELGVGQQGETKEGAGTEEPQVN